MFQISHLSTIMPCFTNYDIRGKVPSQLNENIAYLLGRAYAEIIKPNGSIAVGYDIRLTSPILSKQVIKGLNHAGINTLDLGLCGTELTYFAAGSGKSAGSIMITASHNPKEYNGMKLVKANAIPISAETGLREIAQYIKQHENKQPTISKQIATNTKVNLLPDFIKKIITFTNINVLKPLKIVANPGNGCAGLFLKELQKKLPYQIITINQTPDGNFPNGIPNPLLPNNRPATSKAVLEHNAQLGIAWDGDCDRCFFFDEKGEFIDGYYIVGVIAEQILQNYPKNKIIHDPRMTWNTIEIIKQANGIPIQGKTGHAFIKERMRQEDAVYGGEMSAHHYFRDFYYCDSGMIPWLLITQLLSIKKIPISELVAKYKQRYPASGEINTTVKNPNLVIQQIEKKYKSQASIIDHTDGLSMEFNHTWRFNLRQSQTEPKLRLNVETFENYDLLQIKTEALLNIIKKHK